MPINTLYATLRQRLTQLRPGERVTRLRNWAWLLAGMFTKRSVHLSKIAGPWPSRATLPSRTRRVSRLLDNPAIRVRTWYAPVAQQALRLAARSGCVRLIADGSKVGFDHQLLMVALAWQRRALPLAWTWVKGARGHSSALVQQALLGRVYRLVQTCAPQSRVLVLGDSEFGAVEIMRLLESWGWRYVLRQKRNHLVALPGPAKAVKGPAKGPALWLPLGELVDKAGGCCWLTGVLLTQEHAHPTNVLAWWQRGQSEPWLLATNLSTALETRRAYRCRMWIEEMFGDFKGHGFDLESTHLRQVARLARLTMAVAMLYLWLMQHGAQVIRRGLRHLVDRADRRDYSVFRLGCNMVERCLALGLTPFTCCQPNLSPKLSGG